MKITFSPDQSISKKTIKILVEIDPKEVEVINGDSGLEIQIGDSITEGPVGGPGLPARDVRVALPVGTRPTTVSAVSYATVNLAKQGSTIAPVQPLADAVDDEEELQQLAPRMRPHVLPNKSLYEKAKKSPRPFARLASWDLFGATPVAIIVINPVTVDADNAVDLHTELEITIRYESASAKPKGTSNLRPAVVRNYRDTITAMENFRRLPDAVTSGDFDWQAVTGTQPGRYLVITDDFTWDPTTCEPVSNVPGVIEAFIRLKEWKERRGLRVTLKTVTQIVDDGYGEGGRDLQEAIRRYIKWAHQSLGVSWVLLGGAKPIIPVRYVGNANEHIDSRIPTDFYYSSLTVLNETPPEHDWDPRDIGSYGEDATGANTAGVNFHADVSVGRVPARNADDAEAWVTKLIAYEQFRNPDGSLLSLDWPNQALLVADSWYDWKAPDKPDNSPEPLPIWSYAKRANDTVLINAQLPEANKQDYLWPTGTRIWGRYDDETKVVEINYNRFASPMSPGFCYVTSGKGDIRSDTPTKWILIQGEPDTNVMQATYYCFDHHDELDSSASNQNFLAAQLLDDLEGIQVSKIYEDFKFLEDGTETTVDFLGWGPVLSDRLRAPIPHFLCFSGHGTARGLNHTFHKTNANAVENANNGNHSWITYVYSCNTARYDLEPGDDRGDPPCIGESAVIQPNGGAVAYLGLSRKCKIGYQRQATEPFFRALKTPSTRHLGHMNDARLLRLQTINVEHEDFAFASVFKMNLFGCPEMPVWVGSPRTMGAIFPIAAVLSQPFNVAVTEFRSPGPSNWITLPVAGALVTLRQLDSVTGRWRIVAKRGSDENGNATLSLSKATDGPIEITVSKRGYIPFLGQGSVDV